MCFCYCRRERVTASGGEVGRLSIAGGAEVGVSKSQRHFFSPSNMHYWNLTFFRVVTDWSSPMLARRFMPV